MIDPITFVGVGALAGFEQASDDFQGYGQGAQGYAKRYGAGYADAFVGTSSGAHTAISAETRSTLLLQGTVVFDRGPCTPGHCCDLQGRQ